jgi:hypothetical protein
LIFIKALFSRENSEIIGCLRGGFFVRIQESGCRIQNVGVIVFLCGVFTPHPKRCGGTMLSWQQNYYGSKISIRRAVT